MTTQEKIRTLELLATKLLQACLVEKSPIFGSFGRMSDTFRVNKYLGTDGKKSLYEVGWRFAWNNGKRRIGCCSYDKKTIELSRRYVENTTCDASVFLDTILHEIAHALTPGHNHNNTWKRACVIVGANPSRLCNDERICGANSHLALWTAVCPHCNTVHKKHRRPKYLNNSCCVATPVCRVNRTQLIWRNNVV